MSSWFHSAWLVALASVGVLSCGARASSTERQIPVSDEMATSAPSLNEEKPALAAEDPTGFLDEPSPSPSEATAATGSIEPELAEWSISTTGHELVDGAGNCSLFVDGPNSELMPMDIAVTSGGLGVAHDAACNAAGFYFARRLEGLFIALCERQCALFIADPARTLRVYGNYDLNPSRTPK